MKNNFWEHKNNFIFSYLFNLHLWWKYIQVVYIWIKLHFTFNMLKFRSLWSTENKLHENLCYGKTRDL